MLFRSLIAHDWVGRLDEGGGQRHTLMCEPASTPAAPLVDALLLAPQAAAQSFRQRAGLEQMTLAELLKG